MNGYFADVSNLSYPGILGIDWEAKVAKYTGSSSANSKISFTFRKDVADLVVLALQNPSISANKILRVEGDRRSLNEIVELYERASGVTFEKLPVDESAVSTGPLMADDFDWSDDNAIGPFAKMALRGSAVVNPNGENVDNSLFPQWNPMNMESQAALVWKWAQTL
ncbi:hypothetical protein BDR26DRAFT_853756 [Obelidium mucronatum]|nr:hypothetical protein BDR26DRAFT_853756 [Obelidium mucronatum]